MPNPTAPLPLNALRAFEAAARHGSFQRAAKELFVTPGAVAHQVKLLEERLGVPLFHRHAQGLSVTVGGRRYAETVRGLLDSLAAATRQLQMESRREWVVTISATPSYTTRWLMPRLTGFQQRHKDVEVRVQAQVPPADLLREQVDVSIRLGSGPYPGLLVDDLQQERVMAVASPAYLAVHPVHTVADLAHATLLHDVYEPLLPQQIDWRLWLAAAGAPLQTSPSGHWFSHTYLSIEAALAGQGVALASGAMVDRALELGQLHSVLDGFAVQSPYQYRLLRLAEAEQRPAVKAFCDWILSPQRQQY